MTKFKFLIAAALAAGSLSIPALADTYPSRPIKMVLGFPPGGPTDVTARMFAQAISEDLGQPVVVDNRAGGGSTIATRAVLSAPADGYTILYNTSSLVLAASLYKSANYDVAKDLVPVVRTAGAPMVVAVTSGFPAKTFKEFVDVVKRKPGSYNYGSSGAGTIDHLAPALLLSELNLRMEHVPYAGTAPALVGLASGDTQMMVTTLTTIMPFVADKRLRPLAIASPSRSGMLPEVPTVAEEAGLPNFEMTAWTGIVAAAGTPPAAVARLNESVNKALRNPRFVERLRAAGAEPYGGTAAAYGAYLASESVRWKAVIERAGVQPQ
ncbi:Bug family tripartite tricarboxylate transporter substrate binding protein [Xenophilus azovorans]|uniref:Bug family tripartite tricarboxylate transporter substrate binding protein n=1 Tax=Xenophilus azovorans TaxID=151755 RepID=UPI00056E8AFD|nr:tripartite tricarboxylate transporter substrate binding protein [Xenophilus azovorans]